MKNMIITFLVPVFFAAACKKNEQPDVVVLDTEMDISISNAEGIDLLNPQTSGYIKAEDVDIYILKNGVKEKVFKASADHPENFFIFKAEPTALYLNPGTYYMRLFLNTNTNAENISITYLEIKGHGTDTITAYVSQKPGVTAITKVWFNGDLKWNGDSYHTFEIIK